MAKLREKKKQDSLPKVSFFQHLCKDYHAKFLPNTKLEFCPCLMDTGINGDFNWCNGNQREIVMVKTYGNGKQNVIGPIGKVQTYGNGKQNGIGPIGNVQTYGNGKQNVIGPIGNVQTYGNGKQNVIEPIGKVQTYGNGKQNGIGPKSGMDAKYQWNATFTCHFIAKYIDYRTLKSDTFFK
jgi:hypothetical protein